jgi:hypothetical protein
MNCLSVFYLQKSLRVFSSKHQSGASYLNSESFTDLKNQLFRDGIDDISADTKCSREPSGIVK